MELLSKADDIKHAIYFQQLNKRQVNSLGLGNFNITNGNALQQLAMQAPAAQDAAGACHADYCSY